MLKFRRWSPWSHLQAITAKQQWACPAFLSHQCASDRFPVRWLKGCWKWWWGKRWSVDVLPVSGTDDVRGELIPCGCSLPASSWDHRSSWRWSTAHLTSLLSDRNATPFMIFCVSRTGCDHIFDIIPWRSVTFVSISLFNLLFQGDNLAFVYSNLNKPVSFSLLGQLDQKWNTCSKF